MQRAGRREWIGLAVIALPCLLYSMDLTVLNLARPGDQRATSRRAARELLWIVDIYGFLVAGSLITMGTLGDRIGRRRLLLIGAASFGAASVLAAFATSAGDADRRPRAARRRRRDARALDAGADLQHVRRPAASARSRSASGSRASRPARRSARSLGGVAARVLLVGLGVPDRRAGDGAAARRSAPRLLPESRDPDAGRLDLVSAALSLAAVLAVIYGAQAARRGRRSAGRRALAVVAGVVARRALFVRRQRTLADPLIDLDAVPRSARSAPRSRRTCSASSPPSGSSSSSPSTSSSCSGYSPLEAGLWSLPSSVGFIVGAMLAPLACPAASARRSSIGRRARARRGRASR